jgi:uncharacterized protein (TIGR02466 family)
MGQVFGIFPQPIWYAKIEKELSEKEKKFIEEQECVKNTFNKISINKKILDSEMMKSLRQEFEKEISQYVKTVIVPKNHIEIYITQSWVNYSKARDSHFSHTHPNSLLSGVYYVNAIKEKDAIVFETQHSTIRVETEQFNLFNSASWNVKVETGTFFNFSFKSCA